MSRQSNLRSYIRYSVKPNNTSLVVIPLGAANVMVARDYRCPRSAESDTSKGC
jgi:hypothetical protein